MKKDELEKALDNACVELVKLNHCPDVICHCEIDCFNCWKKYLLKESEK